jgi:hypothetical protein
MTAMVANSWFSFYAFRDFLIISGYLLLFVFRFRAPGSLIDMALATLAVCLVVEASGRLGTTNIDIWGAEGIVDFLGLSNSFGTGIFGSHGILESTLGFPLGVLLLYFLRTRRWLRALIAAILLLMTFKRITFMGVLLAVAFDTGLARARSLEMRRFLASIVVVALSLAAIFSTQLFQDAANSLALDDSSADSVSVGRYDIAIMLWGQFDAGQPLNWVLGFGPGAADAQVASNFILINPHNDWLKILFDYGVAGFVAIHLVLFLILARHRLGLMIYVYSATLMMTDNIFIYMFYQLFVSVSMCSVDQRRKYAIPVR